ncbi:MAG: hypothetical protein HY074_12175 [Deltaproteobacteria bacterium]|nr:hypothetical protein [Deltaproteobacteria bacterium]
MKKHILVIGMGILASATAFAQKTIHCETPTSNVGVNLQKLATPNLYSFSVIEEGVKVAEGTARHNAFTTGSSYSGENFGLHISRFDKHPDFFPTRWAQYWATLEVNGIQGRSVACATWDAPSSN